MVGPFSVLRLFLWLLASIFVSMSVARAQEPEKEKTPGTKETVAPAPASAVKSAADSARSGPTRIMVIPVRDEIAVPVLYIVRRGLKEAIDQKADMVVLDLHTPGGAGSVTFEIMEALGRFPGKTVTYVNTDAASAGAFIAAMTTDIWFAPTGTIGAAAPVQASGEEISPSMRQKIISYLRARIRAVSEGKGDYRGQVISAMIDADYELKIDDKVLKAKGELLSLTATEAMKEYGTPPQRLLAAGISKDLDTLVYKDLGGTTESVQRLSVTWSENVAVMLNSVRTILLGLGLLAAFIEFKTPGFGFFGISACILLAAVFFGHYIAGFSGHEPVLVFAIGLLAVLLELIFFPGVVVVAVAGVIMMLGSLVWSMADLWPNEPISVSGDAFVDPLVNMGVGILVAAILAVVLARFLPRGWLWDRMILSASVGEAAQRTGSEPGLGGSESLVGARGITVTELYPSGQIEVDGRRYEARVEVGTLARGTPIVVRGRSGFGWQVERAEK